MTNTLSATPGNTTVAADLAAFHLRFAGAGGALAGPGGHALVPVSLLDSLRHLRTAGGDVPHGAGTTTVTVLTVPDDIAVVRLSTPPGPGVWPETAAVTELARLRQDWSRRLLRHVLEHLSPRTTGGKPLLDQQLVLAPLADAFIGQEETTTVLSAAEATEDELALVHDRITEVGRTLLRLLGAHGFTADGPGRTAHVSELLAHVYPRRAQHDGT